MPVTQGGMLSGIRGWQYDKGPAIVFTQLSMICKPALLSKQATSVEKGTPSSVLPTPRDYILLNLSTKRVKTWRASTKKPL